MFRNHVAVLSCLAALPMSFLTVTAAQAGTGHAASASHAAPQTDCTPESIPDFSATKFPDKPKVDNKWLPLEPGTRSEFNGTVTDLTSGTPEVHKHRVVSIVTGLTKVIDGVRTVVLWDRDYTDGILGESELAFFAQSSKGAVWLLGEYPEEFDAGTFTGAPNTFISGMDEAKGGIAMQGHPEEGSASYTQASAPAIDFLDCAQVVSKKGNTLKIDEFNPLDGAAVGHQQKYYRAGLGSYKVTASSGDSQEVLNLDKTTTLNSSDLKDVNERAKAQDRHGYEVSPDVYGTTERATDRH